MRTRRIVSLPLRLCLITGILYGYWRARNTGICLTVFPSFVASSPLPSSSLDGDSNAANTPAEPHFTTASKNKKNRGPGVSPKAAPFKLSGWCFRRRCHPQLAGHAAFNFPIRIVRYAIRTFQQDHVFLAVDQCDGSIIARHFFVSAASA